MPAELHDATAGQTAASSQVAQPAQQADAKQVDAKQAEKAEVQAYFESTGFERWNRIYSDSE